LNDVSLIETSALDNSNVEYAFETLISQMYHDLQNTQAHIHAATIQNLAL
jgi:hypothetical protein